MLSDATVIYRMGKQKGPIIQHMDIQYSVINKNGKEYEVGFLYI